MFNATYKCGSRDYLERAKVLLNQNTSQSLFYAALELRSGIEARLQEYLEVQKHISEKQRQGWRIKELGKNLKRVFDDGDQVIEIRLTDENSGEFVTCYYTPVKTTLKKKGQQLGNYLHAMKKVRPPEDNWWNEFKELLKATYEELKFATTGTLCGPPLVIPQGRTQLNHELGHDTTNDEGVLALGGVGRIIQMSVRYFENLPVDRQQV